MNIAANDIKHFFKSLSSSSSSHGKVPKAEIKRVVLERFIQSPEGGHISGEVSRTLEQRVVKNLFHQGSYIIDDHHQKPTDDAIFNWFISGEHGSKLHRRSIVQQDKELEVFLRRNGVDINRHDEKTGDTPLILAARNHDSHMVKALIKDGADINAKNNRKRDAIFEVVSSMNDDSNYKSASLHTTAECLIAHGAEISQIIQNPLKTLSGYAITHSHIDTAKLFITPHPRTFEDATVFALAKSKRPDNSEVIRCIYENFPDIDGNARDENGMTALMIASQHQNPECLKALLEQPQTNMEATTTKSLHGFNKYHTAYSFAFKARNTDCTG